MVEVIFEPRENKSRSWWVGSCCRINVFTPKKSEVFPTPPTTRYVNV